MTIRRRLGASSFTCSSNGRLDAIRVLCAIPACLGNTTKTPAGDLLVSRKLGNRTVVPMVRRRRDKLEDVHNRILLCWMEETEGFRLVAGFSHGDHHATKMQP